MVHNVNVKKLKWFFLRKNVKKLKWFFFEKR